MVLFTQAVIPVVWTSPNGESSAAFGLWTTRWNINFHHSNPFDYNLYFYDRAAIPDFSTAIEKQSQGPFPPKHFTQTAFLISKESLQISVTQAKTADSCS